MTAALTSVGVQQATITIASGSLTGTASISTVGSGASIRWQGNNASDTAAQFDDTNCYVTLSGATLTATRGVTGSSQTITINVTVTDGDTTNLIKSVQTGTVAITTTNTTGTATLSAVTNANAAVAYLGETSSASLTTLSASETALSLSGTTLTSTRLTGTSATVTTGYCVTEYQGAALNSSAQNINFSSSATGTSGTSSITSVTANNAMLEYSGQESPGSNPASGLMRAMLTNGTTITVSWNTSVASQRNYKCVVVEFVAAILAQNVQRGSIALTAQTSNTATITSSPTAQTVANWLGNSTTQTTVDFAVTGYELTQTNATTLTMSVNSSASGTGSYEAINFNPAGGTTYNDTISETATATDSETGTATDAASLSETGTATDSLTATATDPAFLTETSTVTDSYVGGRATNDTLSETSTASDSLTATATGTGILSETGTSSDSYVSASTGSAALTETGISSDLINGALTLNGSMTETIIPIDNFTATLTTNNSITETSISNDTEGGLSAAPYLNLKAITIDHTKVGTINNTDQANFPLLINGTYAYLATIANGGQIQNTVTLNSQIVPADLIFTSDNAGINLLSWEIASYIATTGQIEISVNIPSVSHITDTTIYMWYGNAAITTYQSTSTSTWDSNYKIVSHYANGTTLSVIDSSINANNGTINSATATTGQIDGAANFGGAAYIDYGTGVNITSPITVSAWINPNNVGSATQQNVISQGYNGSTTQWSIQLIASSTHLAWVTFNGSNIGVTSSVATFSNGVSRYIVGTYDGTKWRLFVDGLIDSTVTASGPISTPNKKLEVGSVDINGSPGQFWNGSIDEVRISNIARSADWIITEFNNQNSPSTFYTIKTLIGIAQDIGNLTESVAANDNYIDSSPAPSPMPAAAPQTGSGDDPWRKYLLWLAKKKKSEFKKKAASAGIQEVKAARIADIAAQQVLKQEIELKTPFYENIDEGEQQARNVAQSSILAVYDAVWQQMAVEKRNIEELRLDVEEKQEEDEEEEFFLMMM